MPAAQQDGAISAGGSDWDRASLHCCLLDWMMRCTCDPMSRLPDASSAASQPRSAVVVVVVVDGLVSESFGREAIRGSNRIDPPFASVDADTTPRAAS